MRNFEMMFPTFDDFDKKVIQNIKDNVVKGDTLSWLQDADKYYSPKMTWFILKNQYAKRIAYADSENEFIGYFTNLYIQFTPTFYTRVSAIIEDELANLQDNTKVGIRTKISSKSKRNTSGIGYNEAVNDDDGVRSKEGSTYEQSSGTENILDNARKLASSKISGEIMKYVASFDTLFSSVDMSEEIQSSFTPQLINIVSEMIVTMGELAVTTDKLSKVKVDVLGNVVDFIDYTGELISKETLDELINDEITPVKNRVDAIGAHNFEDDKAIQEQFDTNKPKVVYTKEAVDAKFRQLAKFRGTKATLAEINAITNPVNGDYAHLGSADPYKEYIYDAANNVWEESGIAKPHGEATFGDGTKVSLQKGVAYAISELEEKTITIPAVKETIYDVVLFGKGHKTLDISKTGYRVEGVFPVGYIDDRNHEDNQFIGSVTKFAGIYGFNDEQANWNADQTTITRTYTDGSISNMQPSFLVLYTKVITPAQTIKVLVKK